MNDAGEFKWHNERDPSKPSNFGIFEAEFEPDDLPIPRYGILWPMEDYCDLEKWKDFRS